ncbi:hypothetical protein ABZ845_23560 [Streptomyces sp. NPDC047022]|uniref:hypothetical protein n=1 Tax=Streptomyces sp. NPDC047022 TaxID=3155737 RepID=UPI0033DE617D
MKTRTFRTASRPRPLPRTTLLVTAGTTAVALLTGCGGSGGTSDGASGGDGNVASLPTQGKSGSAAKTGTADPDAGRPQIRLDSSQDEINRMEEAYVSCLKQLVGPDYKQKWVEAAKSGKPRPGEKECHSKDPLQPPELDPDKNPHFADDTREMVNCMNSKGIKSVVDTQQSGWGLVSGDEMSLPGFDDAIRTCQVKAYGGHE